MYMQLLMAQKRRGISPLFWSPFLLDTRVGFMEFTGILLVRKVSCVAHQKDDMSLLLVLWKEAVF